MNILNGNEAFAAMCAGKNIECRFIESSDDFDDIRNFSATVFIDIAFEFRIAITYITIGEMQVPEPIRISPEKGATCSYPSPNTELGVQQFKWNGSKHQLRLLKHGQVHLSLDHATTHCAAIILVSGGDVAEDITQLMKKEDINYAKQAVDVKANSSSIKKTDTSMAIAEVKPSGVESEDTPWETAVDTVTKETKHAFTVDDVEVIEEDPLKIVEKFTAQINACTTTDSALKLRHSFSANGHLDDTHVHHLMKLVEDKCLELDPEQYTPEIEITSQENVTTSEDSLVNETVEQVEPDSEHQERLNTILNGVAHAQTPVEVNAHMRYTKSWTEQQRHPVIQAMNKRLIELNDQKEVDIEQPPSLMVRIQNAQNERELNELLPEICSRHVDIQPKLIDLVKKRRFELKNQGSQVAS